MTPFLAHPAPGVRTVLPNSLTGNAFQANRKEMPEPANAPQLRAKAREFEAMVAGQMLAPMWESVPVDETFGGGHAEEMFRGMLTQEYGKIVSGRGGLGIADAVYREMLRAQEAGKPQTLPGMPGGRLPTGAASLPDPGAALAQMQDGLY